MLKLYQEEKINPAAGCLPILLQIPVFYALYKVLMVAVEMRHQPFALWIKDLSAPDPMTPVNLFGLLDFTPPGFLAIGVLPILLGITMWMQFKLNPAQMDPVQQQIFAIMPWVMMFVMAPFAAGLQLYWVVSNILTIAQQKWLYHRYDLQKDSDAEGAVPAHRHERRCDRREPPSSTERARKLFAGPIDFLKSAPGAAASARARRVPEIAFAGRSNVGKSSLLNALTNRKRAGARLEHAGPDAGAQLSSRSARRCRSAAGRHARLRLCRGAQGHGQALALPDQRLSCAGGRC